MCGRFISRSTPAELAERFHVDEVAVPDEGAPDYNVAPRAKVMVVREREQERVLSRIRWGLVPSWAKEVAIGDRMINARAETLATKPAYRRAFAKRRCIVAADGFYEWKVVGPPSTPKGRPKKQPYFIHRADDAPMAFAGLWEVWKVPPDQVGSAPDDGDGWLRTCVIVTTRANDLLASVHDRMPVVLPEASWDRWLDRDLVDADAVEDLLVPAPDEDFALHPVSTRVNRAANNDELLLSPVPEARPE